MQFTDEHVDDFVKDLENAKNVIDALKARWVPYMVNPPQITEENAKRMEEVALALDNAMEMDL